MLTEEWNKLTDLEKKAIKDAAKAKRDLEHKVKLEVKKEVNNVN